MNLSPAVWHESVPTDPGANLRLRQGLILEAARSRGLRNRLLAMCAEDFLFWARLYLWQYNPFAMEKGPFIPRPYQEKAVLGGEIDIGGQTRYQYGLLESITDAKTVRWPKSRFVGATWLCVAVAVWLALFKDNVKGLFMSRDEDTAEDAEDPDSLFWKVQFVLDHLPDWMRRGSDKKKKGVFKFWNGNTITSTANVEAAGVGGRATFMFIDEFGQFKKGHEIFSMTKDTARCRVFVGTHKGRGTMLHELCFDPKYIDMREIVTHWSMDETKAVGLYRWNDALSKVEILDTSFDFDAICAHNVHKSKVCKECGHKGRREFRFVMEAKPVGGPFPGLRSPWYDAETRDRSDYDVAMNLDIDPIGSSVIFFDSFRIAVLRAECLPPFWQGELIHDPKTAKAIKLERSSAGLLKLWFNPKSDRELPRLRAGAGVDVAAGVGTSPSCLSVFNADTGAKAAQYCNANIYAPEFGVYIVAFLRMILDDKGRHPLLTWESQGSAAFEKMVVQTLKYTRYFDEAHTYRGMTRKRKSVGLTTDNAAILTWMEDYRKELFSRKITNLDEHALDECLNFVYVGNSVVYKARSKGKLAEVAESGASWHHGDIVRADALAVKMLKELGYDQPLDEWREREVIDPRTPAGREKLLELKWAAEEEEVWA